MVKFDFNQVGFGFLFVFGHGKVGHDMRMFNYQWDNHGKRTSNNPINPVHRILNTLGNLGFVLTVLDLLYNNIFWLSYDNMGV